MIIWLFRMFFIFMSTILMVLSTHTGPFSQFLLGLFVVIVLLIGFDIIKFEYGGKNGDRNDN